MFDFLEVFDRTPPKPWETKTNIHKNICSQSDLHQPKKTKREDFTKKKQTQKLRQTKQKQNEKNPCNKEILKQPTRTNQQNPPKNPVFFVVFLQLHFKPIQAIQLFNHQPRDVWHVVRRLEVDLIHYDSAAHKGNCIARYNVAPQSGSPYLKATGDPVTRWALG